MACLQERDKAIPLAQACVVLGLSRATHYRRLRPRLATQTHRRKPPRQLAQAERRSILDILHSSEFLDQAPAEVYGTLLSRGIYKASVRTMYRILAEVGESQERRRGHIHRIWPKPMLTATGPNQVWTWDITKLRGPERGILYHAYVIIDLYSRYVVGWMVAERESKDLAEQLFVETLARHELSGTALTVHSDRGSPMTSDSLVQLFGLLGVTRSLSRPRVSNDNAYSESQFKTLKYQQDYPKRFESPQHARGWLQGFFRWYNGAHCHSALALFTPAEVYSGQYTRIIQVRQAALAAAYEQYPERFVRGAPRQQLPPVEVSINALEPGAMAIRCSEPPPEASVRPSPAQAARDGAQGGSRAAKPPSGCEGTLDAPEHRRTFFTRRVEAAS
jgi:putative transposase